MAQETLTAEQEAAQIRNRLNEIAPLQVDGAVTAVGLARHQAVETRLAWERMWKHGVPIDQRDIWILHGCSGIAHALMALHKADPEKADEVAAQIAEAWEYGETGNLVWEHHGEHAEEIATLAARLAEIAPPSKPEAEIEEIERLRAQVRELTGTLRAIFGSAAAALTVAAGGGSASRPCARHGWQDCEDIVCQQVAQAVDAERQRVLAEIGSQDQP